MKHYNKLMTKCQTCLTTKKLTLYRGYFYCEKCFKHFKKRNEDVLKRDQEYTEQLRKHILGTSNQKENK